MLSPQPPLAPPPEQRSSVTFIPPLHTQRRLWILDHLRTHSIGDILDVGCGEGALIGSLMGRAPWRPLVDISDDESPPPTTTTTTTRLGEKGRKVVGDLFRYLYPRRVRGLDQDEASIGFAVEAISYANRGDGGGWNELPRWVEMECEIWKGGLQVVNETFVGVECVVFSEVIEHLEEEVFDKVGKILLGVYRPRWMLVTTPRYDFNRFFPRSDEGGEGRGFKDPTGRTDRVFRHDDHKLEFLESEFRLWAQSVAEEFGYRVEVEQIGWADGIDDEGASLGAVFTRDDDWQAKANGGNEAFQGDTVQHQLVTKQILAAHPTQSPSPAADILDAARKVAGNIQTRVEDIWFQSEGNEVPLMCGGHIEVLIMALEGAEREERADLRWVEWGHRGEWFVTMN